MTELFNTLKSRASIHERAKLDAMRLKAEQFRMAQGAAQQQDTEGAYSPSSSGLPDIQQQQQYYSSQRVQSQQYRPAPKFSVAPSVYGYAHAQRCRAAGLQGADNLARKAANAPPPPEKAQKQKPSFRPDMDYVYVPPRQQNHIVSMQKANLGQTALLQQLDRGSETLYRDHFLETQQQNDYCTPANRAPCRAGDGLQPLTAAYVVDDGLRRFAKSQTNKLINADDAGGLVMKDINREAEPIMPKDKYIETLKRVTLPRSDAVRPYIGGTCLVRTIKEEKWGDRPPVKMLKMDMRTTYRTEHQPFNEHAYDISARDRAKCRAAFLRDHNGENPVGGGVPHKEMTTKQFFEAPLVQYDQEQRVRAEQQLKENAVEAARKLYDVTTDEARGLVNTLHEGDRQALQFLHTMAKARRQEWGPE